MLLVYNVHIAHIWNGEYCKVFICAPTIYCELKDYCRTSNCGGMRSILLYTFPRDFRLYYNMYRTHPAMGCSLMQLLVLQQNSNISSNQCERVGLQLGLELGWLFHLVWSFRFSRFEFILTNYSVL